MSNAAKVFKTNRVSVVPDSVTFATNVSPGVGVVPSGNTDIMSTSGDALPSLSQCPLHFNDLFNAFGVTPDC